RRGVRLLQRTAAVEPEMEVEKDVIGRASGTNSMTADHLRYGPYDVPHVFFGEDHLVREDARRHLRDLPAGMSNEPGDEERRQRIQDGIPRLHAEQRGQHGDQREHVAARAWHRPAATR